MENAITTDFTELDSCIVIIKYVPCLKCDQCGEVSYVGTVYKRVEEIIDSLKDSLTEIAVVKYSNKAA
jgi:YgiT-type zinc finger domain-containing protein